ncbi:MAG: phage tail protein [Chitinivibrionales bacterium]|nr:phage tail protein [Chitinivibrionales bacterium]
MPSYYPPVGFHFRVEFGFLAQESTDTLFQEVSGMSMSLGTEDYNEGGENRFAHRMPTMAKFSNLTLKRGLLADSQLITWIEHAVTNIEAGDEDNLKPTTVNVTLLNEKSEPVADTYSFVRAWPVKWAVSDFKSTDNSIVVETLELSYNYFSRIQK